MHHSTAPELAALRRLRERFLAARAGADYWRSAEDLALYDATFAERIGWKWDAVLRELDARAWRPVSRHVVDWGCGSGVASRRLLAHWPGQWESLALHDRSAQAMRFAAERARRELPGVAVATGLPARLPEETLLVLSHVLNELPAEDLARLLALARQAREIVWVEAGTHADSRRLITDVREQLLGKFAAVAPCTHQQGCGLLASENAAHWCHHFAPVPSHFFQDASWAEFSRELGIDLRALPYSFLVLERAGEALPTKPGFSRVLGQPRDFKGYSKVLSCQASGVCEWMLQKRDAPELLREVQEGADAMVYRWRMEKGRIAGGEKLGGEIRKT